MMSLPLQQVTPEQIFRICCRALLFLSLVRSVIFFFFKELHTPGVFIFPQEQSEGDVARTNGNHNEQENEEVYYPSIALSAPDHHSL